LLPSPLPHELVVDLGVTLLLAIAGAVMLRGGVAPFGLIVWLLLNLIAMYAPVPYQRRFGFGLLPALAVVAGNALVCACGLLTRRRAAVLRLGVAALAASGTMLVVGAVVWSAMRNWPLPIYRSTVDLDAAAAWLRERSAPDELVIA